MKIDGDGSDGLFLASVMATFLLYYSYSLVTLPLIQQLFNF